MIDSARTVNRSMRLAALVFAMVFATSPTTARLSALLAFGLSTASAQYAISTFAGAPAPSPAPAATSSIGQVSGVAADSEGNVYFGIGLPCIFRVERDGTMTRFAGTCRRGYSGDTGPALDAQLATAGPVAVDSFGNLYIADSGNSRIRRVTPAGIITTIAGGGSAIVADRGDGGPATSAQLSPKSVAVDSHGNLYIGETSGLRKVSPDGIITSLGNGLVGYPFGVGGIAISSDGVVYASEPERNEIRRIAGDGTVSTLTGPFDYPWGLAIHPSGDLLVADTDANRVARVSPDGVVTRVAGSGDFFSPGFSGDGGPAANASLAFPRAVAADSAGNVYIADSSNRRIRKITADGLISTIAGNGTLNFSGDEGPALRAQISRPTGLVLDSGGNLSFADGGNDRIRRISSSGTITTIAGTGIAGFSGDGGAAVNAQFWLQNTRIALARDIAGSLFFNDAGNGRVRKISAEGVISTVLAEASIDSDLAVDSAGLLLVSDFKGIRRFSPSGESATISQTGGRIACDSSGNIFVAESSGVFVNRIRRISSSGVSAVVADGIPGFVVAMAVDPAGTIFVATEAKVFRIVDGAATAIAGNGNLGYSGDGGPALEATIQISSLAVDAAGFIFITDAVNNVIRVLAPTAGQSGAVVP